MAPPTTAEDDALDERELEASRHAHPSNGCSDPACTICGTDVTHLYYDERTGHLHDNVRIFHPARKR